MSAGRKSAAWVAGVAMNPRAALPGRRNAAPPVRAGFRELSRRDPVTREIMQVG